MYICRMKKDEQYLIIHRTFDEVKNEFEERLSSTKSIAKRTKTKNLPDPEDIEFHTFCDLFNDKLLRDNIIGTDKVADNITYKRDRLSHLKIIEIKLLGKESSLSKYFWQRDGFKYIFEVKVNDKHRKLTPGDQLLGAEGITFTVLKVISFSRFVLRTNTSYSNPPFVGQVLIQTQ